MHIKKLITCLSLLVFSSGLLAQDKEMQDFRKELNFYIDFINQKFDSLPVNAANQTRFRKRIDDVFTRYVVAPNSETYDRLIQSKNEENVYFVNWDNRISVYVTHFKINNKPYAVFSYTSRDKNKYFVKDIMANRIVYEGASNLASVENLIALDSLHVMFIEKTGDFRSSRQVFVVSTLKPAWKMIKAFEGKAFGVVPADYFNKQYVKKRTYFQLDCEMETRMAAPPDVTNIQFDPRTKTLSYKQYISKYQPTLIKAVWEKGQFLIDDYRVSEHISGGHVGMPE